MEQRKITEEQFDALWQTAEAAGHGSRLAMGFPAWQRRRRRVMAAVAAVVVMGGATVPLALNGHPDTYENVYCNRDVNSESQWVDLAGELLLES